MGSSKNEEFQIGAMELILRERLRYFRQMEKRKADQHM